MKKLLLLPALVLPLLLSAQCRVDSVPLIDAHFIGADYSYINYLDVDGNIITSGTGYQSTGNSYQSFASPYIYVQKGGLYTFTVSGYSDGPYYQERIWIDFNGDSIYSQSEQAAVSINSSAITNFYSVSIPMTAVADTVCMRIVRLHSASGWGNGPDDACSTVSTGEVEDYKVIISCNSNFTVSFDPNPALCFAAQEYLYAIPDYGNIVWYADTTGTLLDTNNVFQFSPVAGNYDTVFYFRNVTGSCTSSWFTVNVVLLPSPVVNINAPDTVYSCSAVTFDAGTGPGLDLYSWSTGETTQTVTISSGYGGFLSVTVIDMGNGCTGYDQVWTAIAPNPPSTYVHAYPSANFCSDSLYYLAYDSIISPGTCSWVETNTGNPIGSGSYFTIPMQDTGHYFITAYINSMCGPDTANLDIYVAPPATVDSLYSPDGTKDANGIYHFCYTNGSISLVAAGLTGTVTTWDLIDVNAQNVYNIPDDDTISLPSWLMSPGTLYGAVAHFVNAQGCESISDTLFGIPANTISYNFSDTLFACLFPATYSVPVTDYSTYDVLWSTGDTTASITASAPGAFSVTTSDLVSGCVISDNFYVADGRFPNDPLTDTTFACLWPAYFNLANTGYDVFMWTEYSDSWSYMYDYSSPGCSVYYQGSNEYLVLEGQNSHGCQLHDTTYIDFNASFTFSLGPDINTTQSFYTIHGPAGYPYYSWSPGGQTTQNLTVTTPGTYVLTIDNGQGCTYSDTIVITLTIITGLAEENTPGASLFPNPAGDHFTVKSNEPILSVNILDVNGKRVQTITAGTREATIGTQQLANGCYTVEVITKEGIARKKLVIGR